jgi:hypothetical protein
MRKTDPRYPALILKLRIEKQRHNSYGPNSPQARRQKSLFDSAKPDVKIKREIDEIAREVFEVFGVESTFGVGVGVGR